MQTLIILCAYSGWSWLKKVTVDSRLKLFVTIVTEASLISREPTADLRESLHLEDFSENRSVIFPAPVDTVIDSSSTLRQH